MNAYTTTGTAATRGIRQTNPFTTKLKHDINPFDLFPNRRLASLDIWSNCYDRIIKFYEWIIEFL